MDSETHDSANVDDCMRLDAASCSHMMIE
jgi:hypothetical protein